MPRVTKEQAQKLVGKTIYAVRKDGSVVTGKLVRMHQNQLQLVPVVNGKEVQTRAIIPLVLFDLLAIGLFAEAASASAASAVSVPASGPRFRSRFRRSRLRSGLRRPRLRRRLQSMLPARPGL